MRALADFEVAGIQGGKHKPSLFNVAAASLFGGVTNGIVGLITAGPVGALAGFGIGAYEGAAAGLVYEGGTSLADL